jgi:hypothetical protein
MEFNKSATQIAKGSMRGQDHLEELISAEEGDQLLSHPLAE